MVLRSVGEPDEFMLGHWRRHRDRLRRRWRFSRVVAVLVIVVSLIGFLGFGWPWWLFFAPLTALLGLAISLDDSLVIPGRDRPNTPLEVGCVVGAEVTTWEHAPDDTHTVRVIARPLGSATDQLVHGYLTYPTTISCPVEAGVQVGFRRHPSMNHLVWLDHDTTPIAAVRLRHGAQLNGRPAESAQVTAVEVLEADPIGDWWLTQVTVRTDSGATLTETLHRLPEELGRLEPGAMVTVLREARTCAILPQIARSLIPGAQRIAPTNPMMISAVPTSTATRPSVMTTRRHRGRVSPPSGLWAAPVAPTRPKAIAAVRVSPAWVTVPSCGLPCRPL